MARLIAVHGIQRRICKIDYEENGDQYYLDFILRQAGEDVRVTVLYKGVAR